MLCLRATAPIATAARLAAVEHLLRLIALRLLLVRVLLRRLCGGLRRVPRELRARSVANRDQQRGDVFAMLPGLLKGGAGAVGRDAFTPEPDRHGVRIRVGTLDLALRDGVVDIDVLHDAALLVVEAAQEGASAEQPPEAAIRKCGERVR